MAVDGGVYNNLKDYVEKNGEQVISENGGFRFRHPSIHVLATLESDIDAGSGMFDCSYADAVNRRVKDGRI